MCKILKKSNLKYRKRQKAPETTPEKENRQRKCCRITTREFCRPTDDIEVVIDDESYFPYHHDEVPCNAGYYCENREDVPPKVQFKFKSKFEPKVLVWMAISSRGHLMLFFAERNCSVNGEIYRNECISARLVPFLEEYHSDGNYIFWPDLASAHYADATQQLMTEKNAKFPPKAANPPNVPKLRLIEDVWGILKQQVYVGGCQAKTEQQLKMRIKKCVNELDWDVVRDMMATVKTKVRKVADNGYMSLL